MQVQYSWVSWVVILPLYSRWSQTHKKWPCLILCQQLMAVVQNTFSFHIFLLVLIRPFLSIHLLIWLSLTEGITSWLPVSFCNALLSCASNDTRWGEQWYFMGIGDLKKKMIYKVMLRRTKLWFYFIYLFFKSCSLERVTLCCIMHFVFNIP